MRPTIGVVADEFRDGDLAGGEDPLLKYLVGEQIGFAISADMGKMSVRSRRASSRATIARRLPRRPHVASVPAAEQVQRGRRLR